MMVLAHLLLLPSKLRKAHEYASLPNSVPLLLNIFILLITGATATDALDAGRGQNPQHPGTGR
jgi:hypothetical protein